MSRLSSAAAGSVSRSFTYDPLGRVVSQTVFSIGYDFHVGNGTSGADNGNVWAITNYKDQTRNQTFTYDALNRLTSAQNAGTNCAASTVNGKTEYRGS